MERLLGFQSTPGNRAVAALLRQATATGPPLSRPEAHAFDEFCKSYELYPHPDFLFSAAQALRRLGGRSAEAIALYEKYLETGGTKRKKDVEEFLVRLRGLGAAP